MEPGNLILIGAILVAIGGVLAGIGGWCQQKEQITFEKATNSQLENTINSITGGDSYCYIQLQVGGGEGGWISNPFLVCEGDHSMYDVSFRLYDPDDFNDVEPGLSMEEFFKKDIFSAEAGNLGVGRAKPFLLTRRLDLTGVDRKILRADISARNGFFSEELLLKKVDDRWLRAMRLYRGNSSDLIREWAEPDFPKDTNDKIVWD